MAEVGLQDRLLLAIPKKGRLMEPSIALLDRCGIKYRRKARLDVAFSTTMNVAVVFLPAADIALFVGEGKVDMGITGQDMVAESGMTESVDQLLELGFGKCRLCVQAPQSSKIDSGKACAGQRIATTFLHLTDNYFKEIAPNESTKISFISGSVEVACALGLAEAVVDLVESGDTMRAAGLKEVAEIMSSQAVLIGNPKTSKKDVMSLVARRVKGIVDAEKYVMIDYNVRREHLEKATRITPGKNSPTLSPLDDSQWVAVKALILKNESNAILDQLQEVGAEAILIYNIKNCRV
ncbi:uncharacterized protein [Oscarella lobularis]|uniref:uncharacterized protein n=1 Tax=Oscarella lobularis TaxID=121494 RepID=UPI00331345F1